MPEILREILLTVLAAETGFEVISPSDDVSIAELGGRPPDLAVTMIDQGVPERYRELFRLHPGMRLLGLKSHGRDAFLVELQPQSVSLGELSPPGLVDAIRRVTSRPGFESSLAEM